MRTLSLLALALFATSAHAQFEAHEWGTFTSLVGSNGITQDGMYHEDEALPDFVHGFGVTQASLAPPVNPQPQPLPPRRPCHSKMCFGDNNGDQFFSQNVITQKMETPVIYFYSDQPRSVDVNVKFPEGLITETYPAPVATSPTFADLQHAANGDTTFHVDVLSDKSSFSLPYASPQNIYVHARNVNSNLVSVSRELEKFIFYRGIGRFQPRILISSRNGGVDVGSRSVADRPLAMFLVHVAPNGHGQLMTLPMINGQARVSAQDVQALEDHTITKPRKGIETGQGSRNELIQGLTAAGLNNDEAVAMVDTWENGYLKVPGLRLLYILPRAEADSVLPLTISPAPEKLQRVFVGRIEVLLDTEENRILQDVLVERSNFDVNSLGRFAEATLRRVREVYAGSPGATSEMLGIFDTLVTAAKHGDDGNGVN